jgi:hypothetical protein
MNNIDIEIKDKTIEILNHELKIMRSKQAITTETIKTLNSELADSRETEKELKALIIYIIKNQLHNTLTVVSVDELYKIYKRGPEISVDENSAGDFIVREQQHVLKRTIV